jgi:hypothetical protein
MIVTLVLGMFVLFLAAWGAAGFLEGWGFDTLGLWVKGAVLFLIGVAPLAATWTLQHPGSQDRVVEADNADEPGSNGHAPASPVLTEASLCPHCGRSLAPEHTAAGTAGGR